MSLQPLLNAPFIVQLHAISAIIAFFLGTIQLLAPKGTLPHKSLGMVFLVLMAVVAVSSIFIRPAYYGYDLPVIKWFSWIHLFTVLTLWGLIEGIYFLTRSGERLKRHKWSFIGMYVGGLVIAGSFAILLPGRVMNQVIFGG